MQTRDLNVERPREGQARNPKTEGRKKAEIRRPNSAGLPGQCESHLPGPAKLAPVPNAATSHGRRAASSGFGLRPSFGPRPSAFGLAPLLLVLCGCRPAPEPPPSPAAPVTVQTVLPKRGEIARTLTLPAFRILAYQEATLYAKVSGYLKTLTVDKGDSVTQGQFLAEIEVPELLADQAQYRAESTVAHTNYERMAEARQKAPDLVVPQTVDDLRGQWEVAEAKLQRTQTLLRYARIIAPFAGIITARFVDPGAFIPAATTGSTPQSAALLTLMDYTRVRVQVFVPEADVPFITNGVPVKLTLEELPGRTFPGTVTRFAHALDEATKTMLTEIEMPNPTRDLRPGAYASVQFELQRKPDALLLPVQALATEKAGTFVFTIADGKAKKTSVKTGFNDGTNVEITDGVKPGDPVILVGKQALTDGQPVIASETK